ncbi:MAG TPA: VOC family protein [Gaiellaceae bacterium]|jgi:catechol 2,3-dioxygenase-like lactoylglutathione lyase family enzyme|nr:VOC family protein [Gaiellaceae bacterium]
MEPKTLDHVAFWLADREPIAEFVTTKLGLHVIDQQENFTLVGADARRGKLTLFDAEGPRQQGAFKHVALRVSKLPEGDTEFDLGEGLKLVLVEVATDSEYDLDHVALYSADPAKTAEAYEQFGFDPASPSAEGHPRVEVGGAYVEFHPGDPGDPEKPLLNHLAVLVDSVDEHIAEAEEMGVVDNIVEAANTRAVFVWGPERVRIEYVEHKPEFALT